MAEGERERERRKKKRKKEERKKRGREKKEKERREGERVFLLCTTDIILYFFINIQICLSTINLFLVIFNSRYSPFSPRLLQTLPFAWAEGG